MHGRSRFGYTQTLTAAPETLSIKTVVYLIGGTAVIAKSRVIIVTAPVDLIAYHLGVAVEVAARRTLAGPKGATPACVIVNIRECRHSETGGYCCH
jgi:hypothetical protein